MSPYMKCNHAVPYSTIFCNVKFIFQNNDDDAESERKRAKSSENTGRFSNISYGSLTILIQSYLHTTISNVT